MDIITLGIGPDSDIPHLVLTGLGIGSDVPSEIPNVGLLQPGLDQVVFIADSESGIASEYFILPAEIHQISWQVSFASEPSSAEVFLQLSLDAVHWVNADTCDNVLGDLRTLDSSAIFGRIRFGTMEEGIETTVTVNVYVTNEGMLS